VLGWIVAGVVGLGLLGAVLYDARQRHRGVAVRSSGSLSNESMHHRVDINAVPYEPARQAGQRDWATYRKRDRKRDS
jgi:DNA topoisomerase VI subunit B